MLNHRPYFPPNTNRQVFSPERTPSPPYPPTSGRLVFGSQTEPSNSLRPHLSIPIILAGAKETHNPPAISAAAPVVPQRPPIVPIVPIVAQALIPRPLGIQGKQALGLTRGFQLRAALDGWDRDMYNTVQVGIRDPARVHLDFTKRIRAQETPAMAAFLAQAVKEFPILQNYEDAWPAREFAETFINTHMNKLREDLEKVRQKAQNKT